MTRLQNKRVAVIGAGSVSEGIGNGRAIAMLCAQEGASVLAADHDIAAAENTVERITENGGSALAFSMDATNEKDVENLVNTMESLHGGIDILFHVVGMSVPGGVIDTQPNDWDKVLDLNLRSAYLAARAVVPHMSSGTGGSIVFISSLVAVYSGPYSYIAYETSKAGLNRMCRSIARAHAAQNIRANAVMPGMIDTPHVAQYIKDSQSSSSDKRAAAVPMQRQGTAWEVAEAAVFLASDAASYITGVCLPVDGGLSA